MRCADVHPAGLCCELEAGHEGLHRATEVSGGRIIDAAWLIDQLEAPVPSGDTTEDHAST